MALKALTRRRPRLLRLLQRRDCSRRSTVASGQGRLPGLYGGTDYAFDSKLRGTYPRGAPLQRTVVTLVP